MSLEILDYTKPASGRMSSVDVSVSDEQFPVIFTNTPAPDARFSLALYREQLRTASMGRTVMYSEVTTSTQVILHRY